MHSIGASLLDFFYCSRIFRQQNPAGKSCLELATVKDRTLSSLQEERKGGKKGYVAYIMVHWLPRLKHNGIRIMYIHVYTSNGQTANNIHFLYSPVRCIYALKIYYICTVFRTETSLGILRFIGQLWFTLFTLVLGRWVEINGFLFRNIRTNQELNYLQ